MRTVCVKEECDCNVIVQLWHNSFGGTAINVELQHKNVVILESDLLILRNEQCLQYIINCKKKAKEELEALRKITEICTGVIDLDLIKYEILL